MFRGLRRLPQVLQSAEILYSQSLVRGISSTRCVLADRRYTKKHEWIIINGDIATVGISNFAQESLGDIVYAELPEVGRELCAGDSVGAVESVKAASDIYSPIAGTVTEKNEEVENNPSLINKSALDDGWLYKLKIKNAEEINQLMDEISYEKFMKADEQDTH